MSKYFIAFALLILGYLKSADGQAIPLGNSTQSCQPSPCDSRTIRDATVALWSLPDNLTPWGGYLKSQVLAELEQGDDSQLPYLVAMSLHAANLYTGFSEHPALPTAASVYQGLIKATVDLGRVSRVDSGIDRAIRNYGHLLHSSVEYTIQLGLREAGCPNDNTTNESPPTVIEPSFHQYLEKKGDCIPCGIRDTIESLSESNQSIDRTMATAALASMTDSSIELFSHLLTTDHLLKVVRLKGCKIAIPSNCCGPREAELRLRCAVLGRYVGQKIGEITQDSR